MDRAENEDVEVEHVVERLTGKFPSIPPEVVEETVTELHEELDEAPVRDFVPVIVEHDAREKLREAESED